MSETLVATLGAGAQELPRPARRALSRRASLNAVAALVDYSAQLVTSLLVTPFLLRGLGPALYGSWEMLVRIGAYVSATDGRPTAALRLVVAQSQGGDDAARRRMVGGAIAVWLLLLPLVVTVGILLVAWAPSLIGVTGEDARDVRLAATCLAGAMTLGSLAAIPESVLRGMNLGHKRMGVQASLHVLGGVLAATAVWSGLGLAGLGGAALVRAIATGLCFWAVVAHRVPWFGAEHPSRAEVRSLLTMSAWLAAGEFLARVVLASDVVILGALLSPAVVTTYVLTGYAARVAVGVHVFTAGEAMPGIGALMGSAEFARARNARRELLTLTWLYGTVLGTTILLWNRSFLSLWIGDGQFAGPLVAFLIVVIAIQTTFIRLDSGMIDAALRPHQRVVVAAVAASLTLLLSLLLTRQLGIAGLCLGIFAGRSVQSVAYPVLVRRALRGPGATPSTDEVSEARRAVLRGATATALLFSAALAAERHLVASDWARFGAGVLATLAAVAIVASYAGMTPDTRRRLVGRLRGVLTRGTGR